MKKTTIDEVGAAIGISNDEPGLPDDDAVSDVMRELLGRGTPRKKKQANLRAAGYTRVSSTMQLQEGNSLEDQASRIQDFIEAEGWVEVAILADPAQSGRNGRRPNFNRLQKMVRRRQVDVVVVDRIDRVSRNLLTLLRFVKLLRDCDAKFVSLRERIDFYTVWGQLMLYILGALAEFYSEVLSQEIRLQKFHAARSGRLSGAFRLGYCKGNCSECTDPNGEDYCPRYGGHNRTEGKIRVIHPVECEAIRLMFTWYASGRFSYSDIAHRLNREVFALPNGDEVRFRTKGVPGRFPPGAFTKDAIRDIIRNPIYAGYVTYAGSDSDGNKRCKPIHLFEGRHPAIISGKVYVRAQRVRRNRYRRSQSATSPARTYPLSRRVFCADAHQPMRGISAGGGRYRYYSDKLCRYKLPKSYRHQPNVSAPEIEEQVRDLVTRMRIPAEWQERILAYVFCDDGMDELLFEKKIIRERLRRAEELYQRGNYTREQFARVESQYHRQLRALTPTATYAGQESIQLLENLPLLWESLDDEQRNCIYRVVLSGVYVRGKEIAEIEPNDEFQALLEDAADRLVEEKGAQLPYQVVHRASPAREDLKDLLTRG